MWHLWFKNYNSRNINRDNPKAGLSCRIDQGFPIILYDYKYAEQSSRIAGIAADAGYKVSIFAPSFPESGICNPLDFIRDATDVDMARQVAIEEKTFCGQANYSSSPDIEAKIFKISAELMSSRSDFE